ncbi:MAG: hypothetical protein RSA23_00790 [Carnobacterium sp.]
MSESILKFPLDIQMFGEDTTPAPIVPATVAPPAPQSNVSIDYGKIEEIVNNRSNSASDAALKGYLKEQGLSGEELSSAVKSFKESQIKKTTEEQEKIQNALKENKELKEKILNAQIDESLKTKALEQGVASGKIPFLLRLVERNGLLKEDGSINDEKAKESIDELLKNFPELKGSSASSGFTKVGGNKDSGGSNEDEEMQQWLKEAGL